MSQFHRVFFEETAEHLATMENLLLTLDLDAPDAEQLNAIFRAAHSIKGSAGTFGFSDLAEITHLLENLLDRIRKGELRTTEPMIDVFLAAGDVLKTLLAAHRGEAIADPDAAAEICRRLRELADALPAAAAVPPAPTFVAAAAAPPAEDCDLRFTLDNGADGNVDAVEILLEELGHFGTPTIIARPANPDGVWHIRLSRAHDLDEVRGMLEFIAARDSIRIEPVRGEAGASGDDGFGFFEPLPAPPMPADDATYGFFEPLPAAPAPAPAPAVAPKPAATARPGAEASIRVGVDKVDQLINLVGELVITQAMLAQSARQIDPVVFERLHNGLAQLERNTRDLQEAVMSIRMLPMSVVFARFPRVVRDLSHALDKQVELKLSGEDTELDKGLIESIADPLTHLVRNSIDHGIEMPETRRALGKPAAGRIELRAYHQGGNVVIEVEDDGAGLNRGRILAKAKERGLAVHDEMSDQEVFQLVFEAGFSTAEQVTEVSGRGVGMDVVRRNIDALGGRVEIDSTAGRGTRITVRLPLTLAILDGMTVAVGGAAYILPLGYVIESAEIEPGMMKSISGVERLVRLRDAYLPVVVLHEIFRLPGSVPVAPGILIVVEANGMQVALCVDAMLGQQQVVIKSLEANFRKVPGIAGATIMGDGRVALILDVPMLAELGRRASARPALAKETAHA